MDGVVLSIEDFNKCIEAIVTLSNKLCDDWKMNKSEHTTENNKFLTKKQFMMLHNPPNVEIEQKIIATFEFHIAYNISYGVPVLCFNIWKQDGTMVTLEEYWKYNKHLHEYNMLDTLTQMDHPVLNRPIFTLHPCKTQEILQSFIDSSKNPVISWLSVVRRFVNLEMRDEYLQIC